MCTMFFERPVIASWHNWQARRAKSVLSVRWTTVCFLPFTQRARSSSVRIHAHGGGGGFSPLCTRARASALVPSRCPCSCRRGAAARFPSLLVLLPLPLPSCQSPYRSGKIGAVRLFVRVTSAVPPHVNTKHGRRTDIR